LDKRGRGMKVVILAIFLALACSACSAQEILSEWHWVRGVEIQEADTYHLLYYNAPLSVFFVNVSVWPCFGASNLFIKNGGVASAASFDKSNTYKKGNDLASYWASIQYGAVFGLNVTVAVGKFQDYSGSSVSAAFDVVYNNDGNASVPNGYFDRVPQPHSISLSEDHDNDRISITYTKAPTGLGTDTYSYWRYNGTFDSLKTGYVFSTACGVRFFMHSETPESETDLGNGKVKATFSVPFKEGFDGNHNFIVMVERDCSPNDCYEAVYAMVQVNDSASTLTMAVLALLLFFCVLFGLF